MKATARPSAFVFAWVFAVQPRSGPNVIAFGNFGYQSVAAVPATVLAPRVQGLGRVEVGENGFVIDRDFGDPFGIAANQMFGAGVAMGFLQEGGEKRPPPEDGIALPAAALRNDDGAHSSGIEGANQARDQGDVNV